MPDFINKTPSRLWLHIAAGVFIGTVAANATTWAAALWTARATAHQAAEALSRAAAESQQADQAAQRARAQAETRQRQETAARQREAEQLRQRAEAEREQRELAWTRFYRKPPTCDEARGGAWTVECANDYIRAKAKFAAQYDANKQ